jgi:hypothetical protein
MRSIQLGMEVVEADGLLIDPDKAAQLKTYQKA